MEEINKQWSVMVSLEVKSNRLFLLQAGLNVQLPN